MPYAIRPAAAKDALAIAGIYNDAVLHTTATWDERTVTAAERLEWLRQRKQQKYPVLVATLGDTVVGYASLGPFRQWSGYRYTVENSIFITQNHRGKGLGKRMLGALIDEAEALGMHCIIAAVDASNHTSLRLHTSQGFKQVAQIPEAGYKFGRWLDLVLMQRLIPQGPQP